MQFYKQVFPGVQPGDSGIIHHRNFTKMIIASKIEIQPNGLSNSKPVIAYDLCTCGKYFLTKN